jgi:hypothetical protein
MYSYCYLDKNNHIVIAYTQNKNRFNEIVVMGALLSFFKNF